MDGFLLTSPLRPCRVFRRGAPGVSASGKPDRASGFNVVVSDATELAEQVEDAVAFLAMHRAELRRLVDFPFVEGVCLDFSRMLMVQYVAAQFCELPLELIRACADVGVSIELSLYASQSDSEA